MEKKRALLREEIQASKVQNTNTDEDVARNRTEETNGTKETNGTTQESSNGTGAEVKPEDDEWTSSANDAIRFRIVTKEEDMHNESLVFHPIYSHQCFNDEKIRGYKEPKLNFYYTAAFSALVDCTSSESRTNSSDNLWPVVNEKYTVPGQIVSRSDFMKLIDEHRENFRPVGTHFHTYKIQDLTREEDPSTSFEIYRTDFSESKVRNFHQKVQPFVLSFIDGSSEIDMEDPRWEVFYLYQKRSEFGQVHSMFVGFVTVYKFYAYPDKIRKRISQFLILPPYQKKGHGAELLKAIYECSKVSEVKDITVEDPSVEFSRLRDTVDVGYLLSSSSYVKENYTDLPVVIEPKILEEIRNETRLAIDQIKHCLNAIRFKYLDTKKESAYKAFRVQTKKKLFKKYEDILSSFEEDKKKKQEELQKIYKEYEQRLRDIVNRVKFPTAEQSATAS